METNTLLSIDWDWVTGDCCSRCEHSCCGWCKPCQGKSQDERGSYENLYTGWHDRIKKLKSLRYLEGNLWVAECHADILITLHPGIIGTIIHLDSHRDDEDRMSLCCGSWRNYLPKTIEVITKLDSDTRFHDVFVCKSSPWTPKRLDRNFYELISYISDAMNIYPEFVGHKYIELEKEWDKFEKGYKYETRIY
jgi:hypothetical protein